jgi:hypothetical protein
LAQPALSVAVSLVSLSFRLSSCGQLPTGACQDQSLITINGEIKTNNTGMVSKQVKIRKLTREGAVSHFKGHEHATHGGSSVLHKKTPASATLFKVSDAAGHNNRANTTAPVAVRRAIDVFSDY